MGIDLPKFPVVVGTTLAVGLAVLSAPPAAAVPADRVTAAEATVLTMTVSARRVGPQDAFEVRAELVTELDASGVGGEPVQLQWQRLGVPGWRGGGDAVTSGTGDAEWQIDPIPQSRRYRVVYVGTALYAASRSRVADVQVKPVVTAASRRGWVRPDGAVTVATKVRPARAGELVTLQRQISGSWTDVKRKRQDADGRATFSVGGRSNFGPQRYRVSLDERAGHLAAHSAAFVIRTVRVVTYVIETRGKVKGALPSFERRTAEIYADPAGWLRAEVHFKRVRGGGAFSLVLSQAKYVPGFAPICDRYWSCRVGRYVIINENRWRHGTPYFRSAGGTLRQYRAMVVNHETGHWFGLGHASCGGKGKLAPVMMQQSKGLYGCRPNAWPLGWEIARAT